MAGKICLKCGSDNLFCNENKGFALCLDCGERFELEKIEQSITRSWHQGLLDSEYWCMDFCLEAPAPLALSYQRLYDYIKEGNIGCTLFLIRDVFELMVKIPVIMMFNGTHELIANTDNIQDFFKEHSAVRKLYDYSLQTLVTGKWFECLRIAGSMKDGGIYDPVYQSVIQYCRQIKDLFCFNRTSMVTWRNRTVGHSCLAVVPESNYGEIPDILKMFRRIAGESLSFYQRTAFADHTGRLLKGCHVRVGTPETYIACEDFNGIHYEKMNLLVTGHLSNLALYDGYDRGRAYLMDYHTGDRYKDMTLSGYLRNMQKRTRMNMREDYLTAGSVIEDNLKSEDIRALENKLQAHSDIVYIPFLYEWLMKNVRDAQKCKKGVLLFQAERGMGKSTFADTLDQLILSEHVLRYSDTIFGWNDFMQEEAAIRVWHLNASYSSRRDILIEGIKQILLTIEPGFYENGNYYPPNRLTGALDGAYSRLQTVSDAHLLKLGFADCLNRTLKAYRQYTSREKLVLVLDGVDEMPDASWFFELLPEAELLDEGVYLMLTCRMGHELEAKKQLCGQLDALNCAAKLSFGFDAIETESGGKCVRMTENPYYQEAVSQYMAEFSLDEKEDLSDGNGRIRFSTLSAYKKLYQMNPAFRGNLKEKSLLAVYFEELKKSAPDYYVHQIENMLDTLIGAGTPLSLAEFAYLSGEGYISYRFLGLLDDLQAFISVSRSDRGNLYGLAHMQWEDEMHKLHPEGAAMFRKRCAKFMTDVWAMAEDGHVSDLLQPGFEGEYWLMMHLPAIYSRDREAILSNEAEPLCISSIEKVLVALSEDEVFRDAFKTDLLEETGSRRLESDLRELLRDYQACIEVYKDFPCSKWRGLYMTSLRFYHPVMIAMLKFYEAVSDSTGDAAGFEKQVRLHLDMAWLRRNILLADDATEQARQENLRNVLEEYERILALVDNRYPELTAHCLYAEAELYGEMGETGEGMKTAAFLLAFLKNFIDEGPMQSLQMVKCLQLMADLRGRSLLLMLDTDVENLRKHCQSVCEIHHALEAGAVGESILKRTQSGYQQQIRDCYRQACMEYAMAIKAEKERLGSHETEGRLQRFKTNVLNKATEAVIVLSGLLSAIDGAGDMAAVKASVEHCHEDYLGICGEIERELPEKWLMAAEETKPSVMSEKQQQVITEAMVLLSHSIAGENGPEAYNGIVEADTAFARLPRLVREQYAQACEEDYRKAYSSYMEECILADLLPSICSEALAVALEDYFRYVDALPENLERIQAYYRAGLAGESAWKDYHQSVMTHWLERNEHQKRKELLERLMRENSENYPVIEIGGFGDITAVWNRLLNRENMLVDIHALYEDQRRGTLRRISDSLSGAAFSTLFCIRQLSKDYLLVQAVEPPKQWHPEDAELLVKMVLYQSDYRKMAAAGHDDSAVMVVRAVAFKDAYEIAQILFGHQPVMMNTEACDFEIGQRVLDFVLGVCYCEGGCIHRISSNIFMVAPEGVHITSVFDDLQWVEEEDMDGSGPEEAQSNEMQQEDVPVPEETAAVCLKPACFDDIFEMAGKVTPQVWTEFDLSELDGAVREEIVYFMKGVCLAMNGRMDLRENRLNVYLRGRRESHSSRWESYICWPGEADDYEETCFRLLDGYIVIANLEGMERQAARRYLTAVSGFSCSMDYKPQEIQKDIYAFYPN